MTTAISCPAASPTRCASRTRALDYLAGPEAAELTAAALGGVLTSLGELHAKFTAAHAGFLRRFDAAARMTATGTARPRRGWRAMTRLTAGDAKAAVAQMRTLARHPHLADAMAAGAISASWVKQLDRLTRPLPAELRAGTDRILLAAAAAGASLEDLTLLANAAVEQYLAQQPGDDDGDGFDERFVQVSTTFGKAGCVRGNLTPECTAAVQAVLESMGKRRGPEDHRTVGQRYHDALQEACELLLRAKLVPDRAGADTQVIAHIPLRELRGMDGASALEEGWIAARLGGPGYLTGKDAEAAACDAMIVPVVTGHPDMTVIDQVIELVLTAAGHGTGGRGPGGHGGSPGDSGGTPRRRRRPARRGGAAAGGPGRAAVPDRPAGHRLRVRPARHRRAAAHRAAGRPVQHRESSPRHRVLRQHPGAHPPRGRAPRPGLRLAALPPARRGLRRAPHRAQEGRRQDLALRDVFYCASSTMTSASTGGAGRSS